MWIFTTEGFLSVVADRQDPRRGRLLVRARKRKHLTTLLPECPVFQKKPSDYPWRAWATREQVQNLLASQVAALDYDNFKNAIPDEQYHDACTEVWGAMWRYEQEDKPWPTRNR